MQEALGSARSSTAKEEKLLWATFSSSAYVDLLLNWVAHVESLQVRFFESKSPLRKLSVAAYGRQGCLFYCLLTAPTASSGSGYNFFQSGTVSTCALCTNSDLKCLHAAAIHSHCLGCRYQAAMQTKGLQLHGLCFSTLK